MLDRTHASNLTPQRREPAPRTHRPISNPMQQSTGLFAGWGPRIG